MIEAPPKIDSHLKEAVTVLINPNFKEYFDKVEKEYYYWDKAKYHTPPNVKPEDFWAAIKINRHSKHISFGKYIFSYKITDYMQKCLHDFDLNFGGILSSDNLISDKTRQYFLLSSIMEEAIASSQMEGASTTRKVAKEMLRKKKKPTDKSQQMMAGRQLYPVQHLCIRMSSRCHPSVPSH